MFLVFLLVLFVLVFTFQSTLNLILPANTLTKWITRAFQEELAVQTRIQDVRFSLFPRPAVEIRDIVLSDPKSGSEWVRADALEIKLKVLSLFQGRMIPEKLLFRRPRIQIQREPSGKWLFMGYSPSPRKNKGSGRTGFLGDLPIHSIIIKDAWVEILDRHNPSNRPRVVLQELDAHLKGIAGSSPFRVKVKGRFPHRFLEWNSFAMAGEITLSPGPFDLQHLMIDGDLSISQMPEEILRPYVKEFLGLQLISGKTDLQAHYTLRPGKELDMSGELSLNNFLLLMPRYVSRPVAGEKAVVRYSLMGDEEALRIRHLSLESGEGALWGHGIWTGEVNGKPWYGLSLHGTNLTLEGVRAYLPDKLLPDKAAQSLERMTSQGSLDILLLEITAGGNIPPGGGAAGEAPRTSLKVAFHDFGVATDSEVLPIRSVNGEVSLDPESIRFLELRGSYGNSRLEKMEGTFVRGGGRGTDLEANARLNLKEIRELARMFPQSVRGRFGLSLAEQAEGYAEASLRLRASDSEGASLALDGTMDLVGVGFRVRNLPVDLSKVSGRVTFRENNTLPFRLSAKIDQVPCEIKGEVRQVLSPGPSILLRVSADPGAKEFQKEIVTPEGVLKIAKGNPGIKLLLQGRPKDMETDLRLDLTSSALSLSEWMTKKGGVPASLGIKGRFRNGEELVLEKGSWDMAGESVSFSGRMQGGQEPWVKLRIGAEHLSLRPLAQVFPAMAGSGPEAALAGDVRVLFQPGVKGSLDLQGDISLLRAVMQPGFSSRPFREITGTLRLTGKGYAGRGIRCRWGDLPFLLDVAVPVLAAPVPELHVRVPFVDLEPVVQEFFPPDRPGFSMDRKALKERRFQADLIVGRVRLDRKELQDFRAHLIFKDGRLEIPSFAASGLEGRATGEGWIDMTSDEGPLFKAEAKIAGVSAEKYLQLFPYNRTFYAGEISGTIGVEGRLLADLEETARKMKGKAHLRIRSTRERNYLIDFVKEVVQRLEIMIGEKDELFRILEYNEMGGDFTIHDGKFHSRNFYIHQYHTFDVSGLTLDKLTAAVPIRIKYNIKAAGSFDFLDSDIDCYIVAEPFSLTTWIVRKVPIAGKVLTGKDETLYAVYFRYKGHTSHTYHGTEKAARLSRISYEALPELYYDLLKGPD